MTPYDADRETPLRILFVEDSKDDVLLILRHLRKHGIDPDYRRVETRSGMVEALSEVEWELILADYTLPRFSAPKALETLQEAGLDIPFIVISGTIGEASAVELMRAGAHDFLLKGNLARMVPAIERGIREARTRARRREAEEEVQSANARLRRLLSGSPVVIYSADASDVLTTTYISENVAEHFGHPASAFLDHADFWIEHVHPDDRDRILEEFPRKLEEGGGEVEYRFRSADGSYRWIRDGFEVVESAGGGTTEIVGYLLDVTEQRSAEEDLRESEQRFRQLAEHIDEVFWISSPDKSEIEYVSPAFREVWQHPEEALYEDSARWLEDVHPADRERVREAIPRQIEGEYDEEYRIVRPDGEVRWVWDRAYPIRDEEGEVWRIVGVAQDITERKEAVDALEGMERYYRALMEHSADVVFVLEPDATIRQASAAVVELLGVPADELHGRDALDFVHERDRDRVAKRFDNAVSDREGEARASYRVVRADGEIRHVEAVAQNLMDVPAVEGIVVNVRDITEQVDLETQLRQSQKLEAIGRLAGGVAHDFNNLLTVVGGHADLLLEDLPDGSDLWEDADEIKRASRRAAGLTRQLLAFARKQVLEPRTVNLNATVQSVMEMLERVLGEDVVICLDLSEEVLPVHVDPVQLEQVILNLALNARDAMPEGGRLTLRTSPGHEDPAAVDEGTDPTHCVVQIEDTGVGMTEEVRERIFEPFFSTKEKGSGLGLSTVYGIVEQSDGSIDVQSAAGRGTTFTIRLPQGEPASIREDAPPVHEDREKAEEPADEGRTVLVVEDDDGLRPLLQRILERGSFRAITAETPERALEILGGPENGVELVLSDMVLPGMSGTELAREVRARDPGLRFLLISGYSDEEISWEEIPGGRSHFLPKPFSPDELLAKVREVLEEG